eukprot:2180088-Pyramimonas_sp.AAC.1
MENLEDRGSSRTSIVEVRLPGRTGPGLEGPRSSFLFCSPLGLPSRAHGPSRWTPWPTWLA